MGIQNFERGRGWGGLRKLFNYIVTEKEKVINVIVRGHNEGEVRIFFERGGEGEKHSFIIILGLQI